MKIEALYKHIHTGKSTIDSYLDRNLSTRFNNSNLYSKSRELSRARINTTMCNSIRSSNNNMSTMKDPGQRQAFTSFHAGETKRAKTPIQVGTHRLKIR